MALPRFVHKQPLSTPFVLNTCPPAEVSPAPSVLGWPPRSTSTCLGMSVSRFPGSLYVETYKITNCFGVCDRSLADPAGYEHLFGTECRRFAGSSYVETYEVVKRFGVRERIPQNLARALYGTTYKCCHLSYRRSEISEPLNK